jgi:hypothetical protein
MTNQTASEPAPDLIGSIRSAVGSRAGLLVLIFLHIVVCCVSLIRVAEFQSYMLYNPEQLRYAVVAVGVFSIVALLFVFTRFSFGYFIGFSLFTMLLGFIWLNSFSTFYYDHRLAALSAATSALLFLLPALLITAPFKRTLTLSPRILQYLLAAILVLALGTIVTASFYNFRLVSIRQIYDFRNDLNFPTPIRYLIGILSTSLLPFTFACYLALNRRWLAVLPLILLLLFYPITLSKFALFSTAWLIVILLLSRIFESRAATILSILLPTLLGLILIGALFFNRLANDYFGIVNIRMLATPSSAMDIYNDFFASHPLTHFCQISFLKPWMSCPYQEPLSVVMEQTYRLGNLNASLFATEGLASVGHYFAPLAALVCGLVVAIGNRASAGLPSRFVLISGALLPQVFVNVPFTTALLTHGAGFLFLLWYVMPRAIFDREIEPKRPLSEPM